MYVFPFVCLSVCLPDYVVKSGPKTGLVLRSYNFATANDRKACNMVSPDEVQHVRSKSDVSTERLLKGRKYFSQSVMVSFCRCFKTW